MKIGIGYDVHALTENRKLIIGGVNIPHDRGLYGHSDADVLIHAIMDSLLGAMGKGDIGKLFPDTDSKYKDADSRILLREVYELIMENNFTVGNIDAVIIAQKPKMSPFIEEMKNNIAHDLKTDISNINIKATTTEELGFEGRGEGIAAQCVCLLEIKENLWIEAIYWVYINVYPCVKISINNKCNELKFGSAKLTITVQCSLFIVNWYLGG